MFDSTKEDLRDILRWGHEGRLQLPDFQRDYVWGEDDVKSLLASVARGFPVGALLSLETGGNVNFKPRLLEGVAAEHERAETKPMKTPELLLLDGQQRITSLYQALWAENPTRTRSKRDTIVWRYYYLDIEAATAPDADIEEAIISVPEARQTTEDFGRKVDIDLSTPEAEFERNAFPLNRTFDNRAWLRGWSDYWRARDRDVYDLERRFDETVLDRIVRYKMPIIRLDRNNSRQAICVVFEKVNVGGKKLDTFELVTAIYAGADFDLRKDWSGDTRTPGRRARMLGEKERRDVLREIASSDFLQAVSLLHTRERRLGRMAEGYTGKELPQISCQRGTVLELPLEAYQKHADSVERGFTEAARLLNEHKIIWHKDVPYPPLIVGLAAAFAILGSEANGAAAREKLTRWFWSMTLGELYGSATETRLARDVPELVEWIRGKGGEPRSCQDALFSADRLYTLRMRLSAAYKGIHALMMRRGCRDFISGRPVEIMTFFDDKMDIHHVFPRTWCKRAGLDQGTYDSILNKTPLSRASNLAIGGSAPSVYLSRIESKHGVTPDALNAILESHLIDPAHLRNDDFESFISARTTALSGLVADAMGKPVAGRNPSPEPEAQLPIEDDAILEELSDAAE